MITIIFYAQLLTWGELIWTGGILNSLEGVQGGVWGQFSLTARKMLWVHPGPWGGKGEMCKEELHIGSSFASVWAASPCLNWCIPSRAPFYLSLPLFFPGFLLFNSSNSPLLLKSLSGGWVRNYATFGMSQVCLFETWRWSLNSSLHKSVCVHPLHVFTYLKNDYRQTRIEDHKSSIKEGSFEVTISCKRNQQRCELCTGLFSAMRCPFLDPGVDFNVGSILWFAGICSSCLAWTFSECDKRKESKVCRKMTWPVVWTRE